MIRRSTGRDRFVVVEQASVRDERLSFKARGLLAYLLSLPDDWRVNAEDLAGRGPDGRHAVMTGLRELREAGYVTTTRHRQPDGTFRTDSVVHETPQDGTSPECGFPTAVYPTADNRPPNEVPSTKDPDEEPTPMSPSLFGDEPEPETTTTKRKRRKPETPIPDGWEPDDDLRAWAGDNVPGVDVDEQAARFVDHALSKDRRARDWPAAFRNWLRNAAKWSAPPGRTTRMEPSASTDPADYVPRGAATVDDLEAELLAEGTPEGWTDG